MGWPGPLLTDSGGYQVVQLGLLNRIDEPRVVFAPPRGARITLTPGALPWRIQMALGADVVMAL